jgi:probable HAF family extracellular repeat protein
VGSVHAVFWHNNRASVLPTLGTNNCCGSVFNLNDRGQIVGYSQVAGSAFTHAVSWQNGKVTDLGTLPGDASSYAFGINNAGQIVGQSCAADGVTCRAVLWQHGTPIDLNTLVSGPASGTLYVAFDINDFGEVAGQTVNSITETEPPFVAIPNGRWPRARAMLPGVRPSQRLLRRTLPHPPGAHWF